MTDGQPDELWKLQFRQKSYSNKIIPPPYLMAYFFLFIQLQEVSFSYLCVSFL